MNPNEPYIRSMIERLKAIKEMVDVNRHMAAAMLLADISALENLLRDPDINPDTQRGE